MCAWRPPVSLDSNLCAAVATGVCIDAEVNDAVVALPNLDSTSRSFKERASRAHRRSIRTALDGITGRKVVGRIKQVNAIMGHGQKRMIGGSVAPLG